MEQPPTHTSQISQNWADRTSDTIGLVINFLIGMMLLIMCSVIVWQVFTRYALNDASSWSEEVARIMMTYMVMFGSAVVIKTGGHVTVTVLIDRVSPAVLKWLLIVRDLAMLVTLSVITWTGFAFAKLNAVQLSAAMDIPKIYIYAALWIGGGLMMGMLILARLSKNNSNWTAKADGFE
ncbi:TRAP transporter small permease [Celeribacter sp.]|uniref:TRAP transporter small permease n=1 Tax=Celeribacter sp. TaxID=1890673 RepID=UPI003A8FBA6E